MVRTEIMYAAATADVGGESLDFHVICGLAETGVPVVAFLQVRLSENHMAEISKYENVVIRYVPVAAGGKDAVRRFAWTLVSSFHEGNFRFLVSRGLELSRTLAGNQDLHSRLWPLLPSSELQRFFDAPGSSAAYLASIVKSAGIVLTEQHGVVESLREAVGKFAHQVFVLPTFEIDGRVKATSQWFRSLINLMSAERLVLVTESSPSSLTHLGRGGGAPALEQLSHGSHFVVLSDGKNVHRPSANSTVVPVRNLWNMEKRRIAWEVRVFADLFRPTAIIVDDVEVADYMMRNPELAPYVWPVVPANVSPNSETEHQIWGRVLERASTILVENENDRAVLELERPDACGRIVPLRRLPIGVPAAAGGVGVAERLCEIAGRRGANYISSPLQAAKRRIVLASHDFKFAGEIISALRQRADVDLRFDSWRTQISHDHAISSQLTDWADVVFCDFAAPNIAWYIRNKRSGQKLIVRMHGYEVMGSWLSDFDLGRVDLFVFVSESLMQAAVKKFALDATQVVCIPNAVDSLDLERPKMDKSRFHLGIVGIVPILKRPDRALDLLEILVQEDERYTLHIKGRAPWDYRWVWNEPDTRDAYESFYDRIASSPVLRERVGFDDFGPAIGKWFQKIGWVLSPSTRESFHLAAVEGMISGAVPVVWARDGVKSIFGERWVHEDTSQAADHILLANRDESSYLSESELSVSHAARFDSAVVMPIWIDTIMSM